jgi:hypothetical protein
MKRLFASAAMAVLAAACGEKTDTPATPAADAGASGPNAATAAATPAPAAAPADAPGQMAKGNWRYTTTMMGRTVPATEFCYKTDVSVDEAQKMQQQTGTTCSEQSFKHEGDAFVGHMVCTTDVAGKKMTTTTDMRVTGDFKTKYTIDQTSKMDPEPAPGMGEMKMTIMAERIGDC